ncbi:MAG: hypothetical protein GX592_15070 [Clostridiales bacterium]|nr:hypothetical protein [Clostridiales bacterium]
MKRVLGRGLLAALVLLSVALPLAAAEATGGTGGGGLQPEFFNWTYLASVAGATAAVLLIVQYTKAALDKILKIPTRLYAYIVAVAILLLAQGFTVGLSWRDLPLLLLNALIVATAAYGSYELTFAKVDRSA